MASLTATRNPIIVNLTAGQTNGTSAIEYQKDATDELWRRGVGGTWEFIDDPTKLAGFKAVVGKPPVEAGTFPMTLNPGAIWELGVFKRGHGPRRDVIRLAHLVLFAIGNRPKADLIDSEDGTTGGTWHNHHVSTNRPTSAVVAAATLTAPTFNAIAFPNPVIPDGDTQPSLDPATHHDFASVPLLAGRDHFFVVVVIDDQGNWDFRVSRFKTLRRKFTVQFKTLHVFNDGDWATEGQAWFRFTVAFTEPYFVGVIPLEEFVRPEADIDDWGETDRPYSLGFAHIGDLKEVGDDEGTVDWGSGPRGRRPILGRSGGRRGTAAFPRRRWRERAQCDFSARLYGHNRLPLWDRHRLERRLRNVNRPQPQEVRMPQYLVVVEVRNPEHTFAKAIEKHGTDYLRDYLDSKLPAGAPVKVQSVFPVPNSP